MKGKGKYFTKSTLVSINPVDEQDVWNCKWDICLVDGDKERIGWISFEGDKERGTVPISIEIFDKSNRNRGYGTQAIRLMTDWAFLHKDVFEVVTETSPENDSYVMALQKAGYVRREATKTREVYSIIKQRTSWTGLYVALGIPAGMFLSALSAGSIDPWIGLGIGVVVFMLIGVVMDNNEKRYRERITGDKK